MFYCGTSRGRGTRAAGWFADYIADERARGKASESQSEVEAGVKIESAILEGGIKGWVAAGEEYTAWMEGFDERTWTKRSE